MTSRMRLARHWAPLSAAALSLSLLHTLVDWHIGLFGSTSQVLSGGQAALMWMMAALYGWWGWSLAAAAGGQRAYLVSVLVLTAGWAFAGNGLVIAACLPPCPGGFPHQDIAHLGSLVLGAIGGAASWFALKAQPGSVTWAPSVVALAVMITAFTLQAVVSTAP